MVANEGLRKWDLYFMGMTNGQKKKMGCEWLDESKTMDWEDEEEACAWMMMLVPNLEEWAAAIIWQVLDYAKLCDPEGLDIEQLHASVLSILNEATNIHMVAAGEGGGCGLAGQVVIDRSDGGHGHRGSKRIESGV